MVVVNWMVMMMIAVAVLVQGEQVMTSSSWLLVVVVHT